MKIEAVIETLKTGYPNMNQYATSEYEEYADAENLYDMAVDIAIKALVLICESEEMTSKLEKMVMGEEE